MPEIHKLVLVRHGKSTWNEEKLFTGWQDAPLSPRGKQEARRAGKRLKRQGFQFDCVYTSRLTRAIQTAWIMLEHMDQAWLDVHKSWRLNERHYGALESESKVERAELDGEEQVLRWRRSYAVRPPLVDSSDSRHPAHDRRYQNIEPSLLPDGECLKDVVARVLPFWQEEVEPRLKSGERVLVVAHGNSLRALMKYLEGISDRDIVKVNIPTGIPKVYQLNKRLRSVQSWYHAEPDEVERQIREVIAQSRITKAE